MRTLFCAAALLFGSGFCALVYQTVWLRDFRLIFGASTPSTAAVLALFMGGLGLGSLVLGRRADRALRPLALYAVLEVGVTVAAAVSPLLTDGVRAVYLGLGGSSALGDVGATLVRLALSALVIGVPAFLMGGTLPALTRAVTTSTDTGRRGLALLYGMNTLGAVLGVLLPTFVVFERFGFRRTLWLACLLNAVLAALAWAFATTTEGEPAAAREDDAPALAPARGDRGTRLFVMLAAFVVGFAFFVSELVWYRMSAPILGGSSYTFGLVLACALLGVGAGGLLYAAAPPRRASLALLAMTCGLEALLLLVPYALGDEVALIAHHLRTYGITSFAAMVAGWAAIAGLLVVPAAVVAGYQLPLLVALAGSGRDGVGEDTGTVYAANTVGSVLGSLAGGFVLLPVMTAPGAWVFCALLLVGLGAAAIGLSFRTDRLTAALAIPVLVASVLLSTAQGPTSLWRHTGIGAGRHQKVFTSHNQRLAFERHHDAFVIEEHEGRESSVAVYGRESLGLLVNGKSDGNTLGDAQTQVGLGLIPAVLHPAPKRAFVIGLGTGQSAGWLASAPTIESVEVAEIEPAVLLFAARCSDSNEAVLDNPKVKVRIGDGREALMTSSERFDVIVSEPSNPYRAGVSSLFTAEFYDAVAERLEKGGVFAQWTQGYEIDPETLRLVLATLRGSFQYVSVWQLAPFDFLLVATQEAPSLDVADLRSRLRGAAMARGLGEALAVYDVEGLLARHLAAPAFVDTFVAAEPVLSTDDFPLLELRFASSVGRPRGPSLASDLFTAAARRGAHHPEVRGVVDWARVEELRPRASDLLGLAPSVSAHNATMAARHPFARAYGRGSLIEAAAHAHTFTPAPHDVFALIAHAEVLATIPAAKEAYDVAIARVIRAGALTEAAWIQLARQVYATDVLIDPVALLDDAVTRLRTDPWPLSGVITRTLTLLESAAMPEEFARLVVSRLVEAPFVGQNFSFDRWRTAFILTDRLSRDRIPAECVALFDEYLGWEERELRTRVRCYEEHAKERVPAAKRDLEAFLSAEPRSVSDLVLERLSTDAPAPAASHP